MEKIINSFIDKGFNEGLNKEDYIELKNLLININDKNLILKVNTLLSLIYNAGVLNKLSDENIKYIKDNSYLLPLVLTNNNQEKIKITSMDSYMLLCPFHVDHKPSFSVTNHLNYGHCFTCKTNVSNISYLKKQENINYIDATDLLAYIFLFDIKYQNDKVLPLTEKYQETIKSDRYAKLLEQGLIHEINKYGVSSLLLEKYNNMFKTIDRIKNNEYDSNFKLKEENKKLILTNEILKNSNLK